VDFEQSYSEYKRVIDEHLKRALLDGEPDLLYEPVRYILFAGGKRLRPVLLLLACELLGGNPFSALNAAIAVEIFHNFTLVHDDIMDKADMRRGIETIHKKWDLNTAILSGDVMFAIAYRFLTKLEVKRFNEIVDAFTKVAIEVCEGQALDLKLETSFDVGIDDYIEMISKKTASLIKHSVKIGALIADADEGEIQAVESYGLNLGLAFQLQDDLLDVVAGEDFGKSIGGDIVNGKRTFLLLRALQRAEGKEREILLRVFNRDGVDSSLVPLVRDIYYHYGVIDETQEMVKFYTDIAINSIKTLPENKARDMLIWLANKLCERKI
jgi:geranylgeranyl diphosphate synthase type II